MLRPRRAPSGPYGRADREHRFADAHRPQSPERQRPRPPASVLVIAMRTTAGATEIDGVGSVSSVWRGTAAPSRLADHRTAARRAVGDTVAASAALSYTPQIMPGADVAPLVFPPPAESNSGEQVELFYPSPTVGWYGVWMSRAGADADQSLLDDVAACDQPEAECTPSKPTLVKLSTGATALLNDPGGVRWTQGGVMYTVAGPWASFSADLAMPLANALSEAIAKG